jgi:hypothetical protein
MKTVLGEMQKTDERSQMDWADIGGEFRFAPQRCAGLQYARSNKTQGSIAFYLDCGS